MSLQEHKFENFMVKDIILDLVMENRLKGLRIKLLMSWVGIQPHTMGVHGVSCAHVVNRPVPSQPIRTMGVLSWVDSDDILEF